MKRNICISLLAMLAVTPANGADTVLLSDHVITMTTSRPQSSRPLAVAIEDERIVWVGEQNQADEYIDGHTSVVDLGERALLPGFIDAHGHLPTAAQAATLANVASPPVGPVRNIADLQRELRSYAEQRQIPPGQWIVGRGYDDSLLAEQRHPTREELDAVSTTHPVFILHVSGHLGVVNSRGLARVGYSAESPNPAGGHIRRRAQSNEPNGVLEETAMYPVRAAMAEVATDQAAALQAALTEYASFGITTAQDGASSPQNIALLREAAAAGELWLDVVAYPIGMGGLATVKDLYDWGSYQNRLKIGGIKLFLDGSPQGKTAYLTKPYHVPPHGQDDSYRGYPSIPQPQVDALIAGYFSERIPVLAHANGDAAADMLIEAVAAADPNHDHRTVMIHAQTVREDQITSMKSLGMVPSYFSAHTFYWGDWHRDSVLGEVRGSRISPTASTVQRGMVFTVHNDAPVVPPDMIRLLWATTNRETRSGQVLGPEQRLSIYDALRAITIFGAYQNFEEADKGTIEVGKQADLVVLNRDPLSMEPADLLELQVSATYSRGRQVYARD